MIKYDKFQQLLITDPEVQARVAVLKVATELNKDFHNPNITGGFLRDKLLGFEPRDCDVVFEGYQRDQPGILEAIYDAENYLGLPHSDNWECENKKATGISGHLEEDVIGFHSNHTDYLSTLMLSSDGELKIGSQRTIECIENGIYDIRHQGLMIWMAQAGRTYYRVYAGVACRGMYLCQRLGLTASAGAIEVFKRLDEFAERLTDLERESLLKFWKKKTIGIENAEEILERFGIQSLKQA